MRTKVEHWVNILLNRTGYFQFFVSTGLVAIAFALRGVLAPELGTTIPFTFFVSASILSACLGGWKPGFYSMVLGFLVADWFFIPPTGQFGGYGKLDTIVIIANFLPNIIAIVGFEFLHRARRALAIAEMELLKAKAQIERDNAMLETEVKRRTFDLQRSLRFLEQFAYSIAHDLRAPLRAIRGFASALQEDYEGKFDSAADQYMERMSQAALRMDQLITDLLDYARLGHQQLHIVKTSISDAVGSVMAGYKDQLSAITTEIQVQNLHYFVKADRSLLEDVIRRLLSNCIKFRRQDASLSIVISGEETAAGVKVSVRDNGVGISPEHVDKIFGMFQTLAPPKGVETGAGLAFVSKAMERMHGRVGVTSQPGEGSTFWFELPRTM